MANSKKLSNLEKVREAWRIGWAATFRYEGHIDIKYQIVSVKRYDILAISDVSVIGDDDFYHKFPNNGFLNDRIEITGYRYAGDLAGNEEPREGQRFRIRNLNIIAESRPELGGNGSVFFLKDWGYYNKDQIEPVFD